MSKTFAAALAIIALLCGNGVAQDAEDTNWQSEKCRIFEAGWAKALGLFGTDNLNYNFIAQNENFIAGGCSTSERVCPRSDQERNIADVLTIEMMNAGAASTFVPYSCSTSTDGSEAGS